MKEELAGVVSTLERIKKIWDRVHQNIGIHKFAIAFRQ
jgi:hypothetical protein